MSTNNSLISLAVLRSGVGTRSRIKRRLTFFPDRNTTLAAGAQPTTVSNSQRQLHGVSKSSSSAIRILKDFDTTYTHAWAWQRYLLERRLLLQQKQPQELPFEGTQDILMMLEHSDSVYTLGRGAKEMHIHTQREEDRPSLCRSVRGHGTPRLTLEADAKKTIVQYISRQQQQGSCEDPYYPQKQLFHKLTDNVKPVMASNGVPIYRVERGGEVTYHGPGQLVVYPLLDLQNANHYRKDLHWFLRSVEDIILETLLDFGIQGNRDDINTGVWVGAEKIAAVGLSASRWITNHGFAINVHPDLSYFDSSVIVPCGIEGRGVTSIKEQMMKMGRTEIITVQEVASKVADKISSVFGLQLE